MTNKAIIAKIDSVMEIPGADKIQVATVLGESVVVSKDWQVGKVGVLFPVGVALSQEFAAYNNLFRDSTKNKDDTKSGFFEDSLRVRSQPFLKVKSEGFFADLSSLEFTGADVTSLKIGEDFDVLNGKEVCKKYISKETQKRMSNGQVKQVKKTYAPFFEKHVDSEQFRHKAGLISVGSLLSFHAKIHGTSARVAYTLVEVDLPKWKQLVNKVVNIFPTQKWDYVVGSRNVVIQSPEKESFHGKEGYRFEVADMLKPYLEKGMTVYGEIAGYANGQPIMPQHNVKSLKDKVYIKKYGESVKYAYGCKEHEFRFHVYRITRMTHSGEHVDMSQKEMEKWCKDRNILTTFEIHPQMIYNGDVESLKTLVEQQTERPECLTEDYIDPTIISEGVIIRVDSGGKTPDFYKNKSYAFRCMEGLCEAEDPEDAS